MADFELTYKPFGERSILIEWPNRIDENILKDILSFKQIIEKELFKCIIEVNHAYNSILIVYNDLLKYYESKISELKNIYISRRGDIYYASTLWKIPVCYDQSFGIDSEEIIEAKNIDLEQLIELHSNTLYTVYFIGFLPGFLYLGGLNEQLFFPRKSKPKLTVKKGSVAIGESQTGIYPNDSPGGWNIIGNSPINLFNASQKIPCFIKGGDKIQFYPISLKEHLEAIKLIKNNSFQIESEVING
ncbi:MAG: 5-oxoprolinase subunit PxpB [Flavobacteriaceae bacterium]